MAEHPAGEGLRARTRRIDHDVDLLAVCGDHGMVFTRDGSGLAGRGVALRVPVAEVAGALLAIEVDDPLDAPGTGPVAFGALPFLSDPGAEMFVPRVCVGREPDGTRWITTVWGAEEEEPDAGELAAVAGRPSAGAAGASLYREEMGDAARPGDGPSSYAVASVLPPHEWCAAVNRATERIRGGGLDKVVLAREVRITADATIGLSDVLTRLRARFGGCYVFAVDGFCGASPELLVARAGDLVRSQPMAGTAPHTGDPDTDHRLAAALLASATYRHEHQVTIDAVHDTLLRFSSYLDYEPEPSVVPLANVAHLATTVQGRLSHPPASILELRDALHPTPAVCGRPRDAARALIGELEPGGRGRYAGSVGWVDRHGNGTWAVSIRCAQIDGNVARLHAGNGIVGESDPATELAETRAKLQAMLGAIVRP